MPAAAALPSMTSQQCPASTQVLVPKKTLLVVDDNNNDAFGETLKSITDAEREQGHQHGTDPNYKFIIKWQNVFGFLVFHVASAFGLYLWYVTPGILTRTLAREYPL